MTTNRRLNSHDVYSTYMSIKLHFDRGAYNAFRYNFSGPKIKPATLAKSRDRFVYEKLAAKFQKKELLIEYLVANRLHGHTWIRDYTDDVYLDWLGRIQALTYRTNNDLQKLADYATNHDLSFDELLRLDRHEDVPILNLLRREFIAEETVIAIDILTEFLKSINKNLPNDPLEILANMIHRLKRYRPFIESHINKHAAKNTVLNLFTSVHK